MKFSELTGHESIKSTLSHFIGIPGSYLFHGPPSSGKHTTALFMARYFLCQGNIEDECTCESCKSFSGFHPDLLCIGRKNEKILVERVNEIIDFVSRAPLISKTRVVVIDNAHNISYEASDKLLKVLEESLFTFFLVTSELNLVLPTIRSRCIKIYFDPLGFDSLVNILWKKMGFDLSQARLLGWIGVNSSEDVFSNAGAFLKYRDLSFDFIGILTSSSNFIDVWDFIDRIPGNELMLFNSMLTLVLTDVLLLSCSVETIVNADRRQDVVKFSKIMNQKGLILVLNILSRFKNNRCRLNPSIAFKLSLIRVWEIIKS